MIIFTPVGKNFEAISTTYGEHGSKELDKVRKALNLKKDALRAEGSPHSEVLIVPSSKISLNTMGKQVTSKELMETLVGKRKIWTERMANNASGFASVGSEFVSTNDDDEPIRHNRRDSDRKNSAKESIRHARRNNEKRAYPDDRVDDDES